MEALLAPLKLIFRLFSHRSTDNNRTINSGDVTGDSNVVTHDQSIHSSITVNQQTDSTSDRLRIEAAKALWASVMNIKDLPTTGVSIIDLVYPDLDPKTFRRSPDYATLKAALTIESLKPHARAKREAEQYKPYIPDGLWNLLHAYHLVTVRPCVILITEGEERTAKWWDDQLIKKAFSAPGMPERLRGFTPPATSPRLRTLEFIEGEIQAEIQTITGGPL